MFQCAGAAHVLRAAAPPCTRRAERRGSCKARRMAAIGVCARAKCQRRRTGACGTGRPQSMMHIIFHASHRRRQIRRIKYPLKSRHPLTPGSRIRGMHRNCDTTRVARAVSWREAVSCGVVGGRSRCRTRRRTRCRRKGSWRRRRRLGDCAPLLLALGCVTPSQIPAEFAHLADSWKWQRAAAAHTQLAVARWEK